MSALLSVMLLLAVRPPYTPRMCKTRVDFATREYVRYCMAHSKESPTCVAGEDYPEQMIIAATAGGRQGAYFEVLDCSWHPGENPRDKKLKKGEPKPSL